MREEAILSFLVQPFRTDVRSVTPVLNGVPLIELVSRFEGEQRFQPAGGYGGLIPEFFNYGSLSSYFLADFGEDSYFRRLRGIYVLGCQCGEVGCWPLIARVGSDKKSIIWIFFARSTGQNATTRTLGLSSSTWISVVEPSITSSRR